MSVQSFKAAPSDYFDIGHPYLPTKSSCPTWCLKYDEPSKKSKNNQQNNQVLLFVILTYIAIFNYLKNNKIINIYLMPVR